MINNVIILGGHIQALGLARQAHGMGLRVILFLQDGFSVARFSNAVDKVVVCTDMDKLKKELQPYSSKQTLLFPTSDEYIEYLSDHYDELNQLYTLGIPKPDCVNIFADKRKTYQFAERMGIPHPKSIYPDSMKDVRKIADTTTFPVVVKPAVMYSFHKTFGKKAYRCDDAEALISRCKAISLQFPINGLVIQEFLSGGAESLY